MNIRLQLLDDRSRKLPAGLQLALLNHGKEVARATSDDEGYVSFTFESYDAPELSVRLDGIAGTEELVKKLAEASGEQ